MSSSDRVVFDCNVFFQAILSEKGPAFRLFHSVVEGRLTLYVSDYVLAELQTLTADPYIRNKHRLKQTSLDEFFATIRRHATMIDAVPHVFDFPRDPDDAHYVDLALAADAKLIVSRDKDLLSLRDAATSEGRDFMNRYPALQILTPPEVLRLLAAREPPE